jgi:hypothetical protein
MNREGSHCSVYLYVVCDVSAGAAEEPLAKRAKVTSSGAIVPWPVVCSKSVPCFYQ